MAVTDFRANSGDREAASRSVVLVTVDSLRADHCSYWGYERETTPTLDRMAENGLVFEQAIAPGPSTYESMPAVFTGEHMISVAPPDVFDERESGDALDIRTENIELNMNTATIPEWFADRGYATGAFTTNPYTGAHTPFARGFDHYEDFMGEGEGPLMRKAAHLPVLSELKHVVTLLRGDRASKRWTEYHDRVIEWAEEVDPPYFLWLFLLDTHTPYLTDRQHREQFNRGRGEMYYHNWRLWFEKKWRDEHDPGALNRDALVDLYDAAVRSVDTCLGALGNNLPDDPIMLVHSDHGEAFGEHGQFGHDAQLFEENLHVPLVVANGGIAGSISSPVSLVNLPTILKAATTGASPPVDNSPVLAKTLDGNQFALRGSDWKYLCEVDTDDRRILNGSAYDLASNPEERVPTDTPSLLAFARNRIRQQLQHEDERGRIMESVAEHLSVNQHEH